MTIVRSRRTSGRAIRDVFAIARPWFWFVSLVPYYVGFLLASHRLLPTMAELPKLAAGALVIGPLVWLAVLAINDAHDLNGDLLNPRKENTPLTSGRITPSTAGRLAAGSAAAAMAVAVAVGPAFAAGTAVALLVGWAYSAPPIRLKTRPGADIVVNAVALGGFGPLAGWVVIEPVGDFPWAMAVLGTLVGAALYVPTTLADLQADRASGYTTIAVRLGRERAYRLGVAIWVTAAGLSLVLAAADHVIPRRMLALELVMVPLLVVAYRRLIGTEQSFRGVIVVATIFLAPCATFALMYTGHW